MQSKRQRNQLLHLQPGNVQIQHFPPDTAPHKSTTPCVSCIVHTFRPHATSPGAVSATARTVPHELRRHSRRHTALGPPASSLSPWKCPRLGRPSPLWQGTRVQPQWPYGRKAISTKHTSKRLLKWTTQNSWRMAGGETNHSVRHFPLPDAGPPSRDAAWSGSGPAECSPCAKFHHTALHPDPSQVEGLRILDAIQTALHNSLRWFRASSSCSQATALSSWSKYLCKLSTLGHKKLPQ